LINNDGQEMILNWSWMVHRKWF